MGWEASVGEWRQRKSSRKKEREEKRQMETLEEENQGGRSGHIDANEENSLAACLNLKLRCNLNLLTLTKPAVLFLKNPAYFGSGAYTRRREGNVQQHPRGLNVQLT